MRLMPVRGAGVPWLWLCLELGLAGDVCAARGGLDPGPAQPGQVLESQVPGPPLMVTCLLCSR